MTRARLVLALFVSVGLIGGATLFRVLSENSPSAGLYLAESDSISTSTVYEAAPIPLVQGTSRPTTETDLIGRQLLLDFIDLSSRGQATEENVQTVANKNIETIGSLTVGKKINAFDLQLVADTKANLVNYDSLTTTLYNNYQNKIYKIYNTFKNTGTVDAGVIKMAQAASIAYTEAAVSFQNISVPYAVAEEHIRFVNLLYEEAAAMKAINEVEKDSTVGFAGLVSISQNSEKEREIINAIMDILKRNGL